MQQRAASIQDGLRRLRDYPSLADVPEDTINDLYARLAALLPSAYDADARPPPVTILLTAMGAIIFFEPLQSSAIASHNAVFAAAAQQLLEQYLEAPDDALINDEPFILAFTAWFLRVGGHVRYSFC